jgi:aconitate hydratase
MGILPLQFREGETAESLGLTGKEQFTINLKSDDIKVGQEVEIETSTGKKFKTKIRVDTEPEV